MYPIPGRHTETTNAVFGSVSGMADDTQPNGRRLGLHGMTGNISGIYRQLPANLAPLALAVLLAATIGGFWALCAAVSLGE